MVSRVARMLTGAPVRFLLFALLAGLLASCRSAPLYEAVETPFNATQSATLPKLTHAIKQAGASLGWQMKEVGPGKITGELRLRRHLAVVDIIYNQTNFSIRYNPRTQNLNYGAGSIHSNYNGWVKNLEQKIRAFASTI